MAVRLNPSSFLPGRFPQSDPARPADYDWVESFEDTRQDKPTWFYPWQGTGVYKVVSPLDGGLSLVARLRLHGTHRKKPKVVGGGLRRLATFSDLFYGRLQLNPSFLNMGNMLSSQTRQVELWNASFRVVSVTDVLKANDDGIELQLPSATPFTLQPLQAVTITVGVASAGPTTIDASFTFDANVIEDVVLRVVGTRAVIFSLMPDTSKPYIEKLGWVSSVITSHDNTEQRIALNEYPDTQISMTVQQHREKIHNLTSLLWGWQHRVYYLPLWHRHTNVAQSTAEAATTIMCPTQYTGLKPGSIGLVWAEYDYFETFEVVDVQPDKITTARPLQRRWPRGALVAACRAARLPQEVNRSWQTPDLASVPLTFVFDQVEQEEPFEFGPTYRDVPLLLTAPNWVSELDERNVRNIDIFETEMKARFTVLNNELPYVVIGHAWFLSSKEKIDQFRRWLYSRRGRVMPFWMPSWKNDISLAARIEAGSFSMEIRSIGFRSFYQHREGRQDIIIFRRGGSPLLRRIANAAEGNSPDTEILVLDQEIPATIEVGSVAMISFLSPYRLDADEVELDWRSDKLVLSEQNMRMLTDGL